MSEKIIAACGNDCAACPRYLGLTSIEYKADVESREQEILYFFKCI